MMRPWLRCWPSLNARALVYVQASRHVDLDHRAIVAIGAGQPHANDRRDQRRLDRVLTDRAHELLDQIETVDRDPDDLAGSIIDAEDEDGIARVRERGQLIREVIPGWPYHAVAAEPDSLELEHGVLTQADLVEQLFLRVKHLEHHQ
jgi:hypothetical protein